MITRFFFLEFHFFFFLTHIIRLLSPLLFARILKQAHSVMYQFFRLFWRHFSQTCKPGLQNGPGLLPWISPSQIIDNLRVPFIFSPVLSPSSVDSKPESFLIYSLILDKNISFSSFQRKDARMVTLYIYTSIYYIVLPIVIRLQSRSLGSVIAHKKYWLHVWVGWLGGSADLGWELAGYWLILLFLV